MVPGKGFIFRTDVISIDGNEKENITRPSRSRNKRPGLPTGLEGRDREFGHTGDSEHINSTNSANNNTAHDDIFQRLREL